MFSAFLPQLSDWRDLTRVNYWFWVIEYNIRRFVFKVRSDSCWEKSLHSVCQWIVNIPCCRLWTDSFTVLIWTARLCRRVLRLHPCTMVSSAVPRSGRSVRQISAGINCYMSQPLVTLSLRCWCAGVWQEALGALFAANSLSPSVSECWQT